MKRLLLFTGLVLLFLCPMQAQQEGDSDRFSTARELAFSGEYAAAVKILLSLRKLAPDNPELTLFLSRVYSWQKEYDAAIGLLKPLAASGPSSSEARDLLVTIYLWDQNYEEALVVINRAPEKAAMLFRIRKARALHGLGENKAALEVLQEVLSDQGQQKEARALQTLIYKENKKEIGLSYRNTSFSDPRAVSWHNLELSYKQDVGKLPVVVRYSHGRMHMRNGNQLELEVYPKLNENSYLHLNAAASLDGGIFPSIRGGIEYYFLLKDRLGASVGTKYLDFDNTRVHLFTGSLGYQLDAQLRITYRPFISYLSESWGWTHTLALRTSKPLKEQFFQLDLQYGSVPYEYFITESFTDLQSFRLGFQYHFRLSEHFLLQPIFLYEYQEYSPGQYRNRFNSQLLSIFRF